MDCDALVELVTDYLEGTLDPVERARFDEHLKICEGCEIYLQQFRQTIDLTGRLATADVPDPARAKLLDVFRSFKRRS